MKQYFLWLAKFITVLVVIFVVVPVLMIGVFAGIASQGTKKSPSDTNSVAVIELTGVIENTKDVMEQLYKQADDKRVTGIVLRIDSPGGAVGPSQDIYEAVKKLKSRKPIVASMGSVAASGGFYSAIAASKVFCEPGTLTGSIGVIMQIPNFRQITEKLGVDVVTLKSGKLKDTGNMFREMTDEERAYLQSTIDTVHSQFIKAVAESRNLDEAKVREFADGRVILGSQAKTLGLVDEFGDLDAAARAVYEIAGHPLPAGESPTLFYPSDKLGGLKKLLESAISLPSMLQPNRYQISYLMQ